MQSKFLFFPIQKDMDQVLLATLSYQNRSVVRKTFSKEEDARLVEIVKLMGDNFEGWNVVAEKMKTRTARQCRERWVSYLSPTIRVEKWTEDEDRILIDKINKIGKKWTDIASFFNGRSGSDIKNRWYSHLKDITFVNDANKIEFLTDPTSNKKKRNRKVVSAYEQALKLLEMKDGSQNKTNSQDHSEFSNITDSKNEKAINNYTCMQNEIINNNNMNSILDFKDDNKKESYTSQSQIHIDCSQKNNKNHIILPPIHQLIDNMNHCLPLF